MLNRKQRQKTSGAAKPEGSGPSGPVYLGRRTKDLVARLPVGAIAVIDHADLDAVAARGLIRRQPAAVVNNRPSVSGRYPNRGPSALLQAGIPIYDVIRLEGATDLDLFAVLQEGDRATLAADCLLRNGQTVARVEALTLDVLEPRLLAARANLGKELSAFAENTLQFLEHEEERALLLDPVTVPDVQVRIDGRPVLVAVRGEHYEADLERLGGYIREQKPVIVAVDGAADTLLQSGFRPDIILGDMDSVGDAALRCGAELIVHAYTRPRGDTAAPGLERIRQLGLEAKTFPVPGTSEDAALLLAFEKGADLIVAVGTHTNLEDFLDKGRRGMASTFLVRLKVGSRLVDARGVSRLYQRRERVGPLYVVLLLSALFPIVVLFWSTPSGQVAWRSIVLWFRLLFR